MRKQTEAAIQRALVQHIQLRLAPNVWWTATANGIRSNPIAMRNAKLTGVRPGAPDLLFLRNGEFFGLELKAPHGRPSLLQLEHIDEIRNAGGYAVVAEGFEEAIRILECWGIITVGGKIGKRRIDSAAHQDEQSKPANRKLGPVETDNIAKIGRRIRVVRPAGT